MADAINPNYYQRNGTQLIDVIEDLPMCRGNAVKYLVRAGNKNPDTLLEDLEKAKWYVEREISRVERAGFRARAAAEREADD